MRWILRVLAVIGLLLLGGGGWLTYTLNNPQGLAAYDPLLLPAAEAKTGNQGNGGLRVTFLGVSSLLFDDGETAILTDGFFTRPGKWDTFFGKVTPDLQVVEATLKRAGIKQLAAVIPVHSHYDHAMDSPAIAERTGALLVGSNSTANIGRGWGMAEDRIRIVRDGETLRFGRFQVTMILSMHFPHPLARGEIEQPLKPPVSSFAYRDGGAYSIIIEHDGRRILVQGSAGFVDGVLDKSQADVVYLGIGGLGTKNDAYRDEYWRQVVAPVRPKRIIPIHWDDFSRSLDQPLKALPWPLDNVPVSLDYLIARSKREGVDMRMPMLWEKADPFAGL